MSIVVFDVSLCLIISKQAIKREQGLFCQVDLKLIDLLYLISRKNYFCCLEN